MECYFTKRFNNVGLIWCKIKYYWQLHCSNVCKLDAVYVWL